MFDNNNFKKSFYGQEFRQPLFPLIVIHFFFSIYTVESPLGHQSKSTGLF